MMTYRLTRRARLDVLSIWRRIAKDNEPAADRFINVLTHHLLLLGDAPHAAARVPQLTRGRLPDSPPHHGARVSCTWCMAGAILKPYSAIKSCGKISASPPVRRDFLTPSDERPG